MIIGNLALEILQMPDSNLGPLDTRAKALSTDWARKLSTMASNTNIRTTQYAMHHDMMVLEKKRYFFLLVSMVLFQDPVICSSLKYIY